MSTASAAGILLIGLNLLAWPYFLFLLVSSIAAWAGRRSPRGETQPKRRFLIVVPAHNEEDGLGATVRSCRGLDYPHELFEVLVIADNCTDGTASVARAEGAEVLERHDETKKSKGFAIEHLIDGMKESGRLARYDALVVIDADSTAPGGYQGHTTANDTLTTIVERLDVDVAKRIVPGEIPSVPGEIVTVRTDVLDVEIE